VFGSSSTQNNREKQAQVFNYRIYPFFTEESLAHKVCLLLVELLICLRRVEEALECIGYILIQFGSTKNIQILDEPAEKKPVIFDAATDAFRRKLLHCKTRCFLLCSYVPGALRELPPIDNLPTDLVSHLSL